MKYSIRKNSEKKFIGNLKVYFLIMNMVLAVIASSYLVSALLDPLGGGAGAISKDYSSGVVTPLGSGSSGASTLLTPSMGGDIPITPIGNPISAWDYGNVISVPQTGAIGSAGTVTVTKTGTSIGTSIAQFNGAVILQNLAIAGGIGLIGAFLGGLAGGKSGQFWGFVSGFTGTITYQVLQAWYPLLGWGWSLSAGVGVGALIFLLTYKSENTGIVNFNCLPWQAPIGGANCEACNKLSECSEYTCKSFGQACAIINAGTSEQKCFWKNPYDTSTPTVELSGLSKGYKSIPDRAVRPPATGVQIIPQTGSSVDNGDCVKAFFPIEFTIVNNKPSQCKIDYKNANFSDMNFYVGGDNLFNYSHGEKLALPGPDAVNQIAPEIHNDGTYTLYVKCQDANGDINVNPFSIKFCVEKGPDTTPPIIVNVSIPSGNPIQYNRTSIPIEVYVNEPSECKWSRSDIDYDKMENKMSCDTEVWQMNSNDVYTCRTTLTGLENSKDNNYYFRCKDQPYLNAGRNAMQQSYAYTLIGTQPLTILSSGPDGTITGASDVIPVNLTINTDNGYNNGQATCYYARGSLPRESDYIRFLNTNSNVHSQRQDLPSGSYTYSFKCVDLGGNAAYNSTNFLVNVDKQSPVVTRVYRQSGQMTIVTDEESQCSYSVKDCNFEVDAGIKMITSDYYTQSADWKLDQNYFIRCKDSYGNQPDPNTCSIVVKAARAPDNQTVSNF